MTGQKKARRSGIVCSMTLAELVGVIVYMLIPYLAAAFDSSAEVVGFATRQAHVEALFYCFLAFSHCIAGIMRGAGKIRGADVRDAGFMVYHPDHIHYDNRAFYSEDPGDLLGVSADVVDQLDYFPCVFPESGLDSQF